MEDALKLCFAIIGALATIGGFIYWHFKTVNSFKDDIHKLELKFKELEKRDELQQKTLDQLSELYPVLKVIIDKLNINKTKK